MSSPVTIGDLLLVAFVQVSLVASLLLLAFCWMTRRRNGGRH